jgi:epoxide hydrolase-like predicted phosphatase
VTPRALVVDWGGVLTPGVGDALRTWALAEGLDPGALKDAFSQWRSARTDGDVGEDLVATIEHMERGEIDQTVVEAVIADRLKAAGAAEVVRHGLLTRMLSFFTPDEPMTALVRRARRAGIRTGLLSNSWGDHYPEHLWDGMFDVVVLSGEVGMRKPDPAIYLHTLSLLRVEPSACVFVDDLPGNVAAAQALGLVGVLHTGYEATVQALSGLFGLDLARDDDVG